LARRAAEIAAEKQAQDIVVLDVRGIVGFTDFFVISNGSTSRQVNAIRDEVVRQLKKEKVLPLQYEGSTASGWLLVDYGDVIVHIFAPEQREYYQLDKLWTDAETVLRIQ
jgi:ribosome-associated protein